MKAHETVKCITSTRKILNKTLYIYEKKEYEQRTETKIKNVIQKGRKQTSQRHEQEKKDKHKNRWYHKNEVMRAR